jgi:uroporphyrinogen III methyltransferase/synthase
VRVFFDHLQALGADVRDWHGARFAAIGPQTAKAVQRYGVRVDTIPAEFRAEAVVDALLQAGVAGKRVLLPRAAGARDVLPAELQRHGALVEEVATYTTALPSDTLGELRDLLLRGDADLVTFTSSSTVQNFVAILAGEVDRVLAHAAVGCIGPVTAETARSCGMQVAIQPSTYTIPAFVDAIVRYYTDEPRRSRQAN